MVRNATLASMFTADSVATVLLHLPESTRAATMTGCAFEHAYSSITGTTE